jgi:hypothetical protein
MARRCIYSFLAGAILAHLGMAASVAVGLGFSPQILFVGLAIIAFALSFIPRQILLILMVLGVVISLISSLFLAQPTTSGTGHPLSLKNGVVPQFWHWWRQV